MTISKTQEAAELLDLARVAFDAHLLEEAQQHLRKVLEINPSLPTARILEARIRLQQNLPRHALAALDSHDFYHPEDRHRPDITLLRIQGLIRAGFDDMALGQLEEMARNFSDDVRPHRMIAALAMKLNKSDRAITALHEVVRLEPSDRPARMNLAQLLSDAQPQAAIDLLLKGHPETDLGVRWKLARLYRRSGREREAQEAYAALLADAPQTETLWLESGQVADSLGDHVTAVMHLQQALRLCPGNGVEALSQLAMAHMHAGQILAASRYWWRLARRNPENSRAWAGLLVCALAADRLRLARRVQKKLTVQTSKKERQKLLADVWQHLAGGLAIYQALAREETVTLVASPLEQLLRKAAQTFEDHLVGHPRRADSHFHLAACRVALADQENASASVNEALAINPEYAAAIRLRARLRQAA